MGIGSDRREGVYPYNFGPPTSGSAKSPRAKTPPPSQRVAHMVAIGELVQKIRSIMRIRQADLALRAGVSRQWIIALEQGKPSLEIGLVMRTLETLGLDVELRPTDPMPPWIFRAKHDAERARFEVQSRRRARRRTRRQAERLSRQWTNLPKVWPELE